MERRKQVKDQFGKLVEGTVVDVAESTERFSELTLEDGTILKTKIVAVEAIRLDNQWDNEGHPVYILKSQNIVAVTYSLEGLKKKA